ncbi:MAG TPA: DUF2752 domain-containing protein [Mucilaginibacter sp.]
MPGKEKLYFALPLLIIAALAVIYYNFNPAEYSFFPKCPFHTLTGYDCPGCGSQRAIYKLLHGDIIGAARENLLLVLSLPFLAIHFFFKIKSVILDKDLRWKVIYHPLTPKIVGALAVIFWIIRNIPGYPFNYLLSN